MWQIVFANLLGIGSFFFWIGETIQQSETGKPHSWIPVPVIRDFIDNVVILFPYGNIIQYHLKLFTIILLSICAVSYIVYLYYKRNYSNRLSIDFFVKNQLELVLALSLIFFPLLFSFIISRVSTSIFFERYFIASCLGVFLLFTISFSLLYTQFGKQSHWILFVATLLGLSGIVFHTIRNKDSVRNIIEQLEQVVKYENADVIFESPHHFVPSNFYSNIFRSVYPLDWKVATDTSNSLAATSDDKLMDRLRIFYNIDAVKSTARIFRDRGKIYYVLDEPDKQWYEYYLKRGKIQWLADAHYLEHGVILRKIKVN
jgi:hypothetical protein